VKPDQSIIIAPPAPVAEVTFQPKALAMRQQALEASAIIGRVSTPEENAKAAAAQEVLASVSRMFEAARHEVTAPLLQAQRAIKKSVDEQRADLESERFRLSRLCGDYLALEDQKRRAAEALRQAELSKFEQERMAEIAQAKTHDAVDEIQEKFDAQAFALVPTGVAPVRASGQTARYDWEISRINEHVLAKARPDLVRRIEFDMRALKDALTRGDKLPGVEAKRVLNAGVRTRPAIDV